MAQTAPDLQTLMHEAGKAQFVDLDDLEIDRDYQPPSRQRISRIRPMAERWQQRLVGSLLCSLRTNGIIYVVDGATRLEAANLRNELIRNGTHPDWSTIPGVWCIVHTGLTAADEAQMFVDLNGPGRLSVHVVDRYGALLFRHDQGAMAIQEALDVWSLKVAYAPDTDAISAVQTLEHLRDWEVLVDTLEVIETAWPATVAAHQRNTLLAIGALILTHGALPKFDLEMVSETLFHMSPRRLAEDALRGAVKPNSYTGRSAWAAMAALVLEAVNDSLPRADRLPPFVQPKLPRAQARITKSTENRRK